MQPYQRVAGAPEAAQRLPLGQAEASAPGLPAQHALHPRRRAPLGPQTHAVVAGLQPLAAVRAHRVLT